MSSPENFDYVSAGKAQILIAVLSFMQVAYWLVIGHDAAVRANRVSATFIQYIDWACIVLAVLAMVPLLRGSYLYRKGCKIQEDQNV